jgi:hypothetical protein
MTSSSKWPKNELLEAAFLTCWACTLWFFLIPALPTLPAVMSYSSGEVTEFGRRLAGWIVNIGVVIVVFKWYDFFVQLKRCRSSRLAGTVNG